MVSLHNTPYRKQKQRKSGRAGCDLFLIKKRIKIKSYAQVIHN